MDKNIVNILSIVSTIVGIVVPIGALIKIPLKAFKRHLQRPKEEQDRKIDMLQLSVNNLKKDIRNNEKEKEKIDLKLAEHEAELKLLIQERGNKNG